MTRPALPLPKGDRNENPPGLSLRQLLHEDWVTHDKSVWEKGFWAVAVHRFGNWRMGVRWKVARAPLTLLYRVLYFLVEVLTGITLPYTTKLGRRVRIWHHSGMILHARSIGDDCHIRHNTTFGVAHRGDNLRIPVIEDRVDIGCGVAVLGDIVIGHDSVIGANAVVTRDVPPWSVAVGLPARVVKSRQPGSRVDAEPPAERPLDLDRHLVGHRPPEQHQPA